MHINCKILFLSFDIIIIIIIYNLAFKNPSVSRMHWKGSNEILHSFTTPEFAGHFCWAKNGIFLANICPKSLFVFFCLEQNWQNLLAVQPPLKWIYLELGMAFHLNCQWSTLLFGFSKEKSQALFPEPVYFKFYCQSSRHIKCKQHQDKCVA